MLTKQMKQTKDKNNNGSDIYQMDSTITFKSMATIPLLIYFLSLKSSVTVS